MNIQSLCCLLAIWLSANSLLGSPPDTTAKKRNLSRYVQLSGFLNAGANFYHVQGIPARRDQWSWIASGNLNVRLFNQLDLPLGFTYTKQRRSFSTPFNQLGISPRFKWLTLHAGFRNLSLSPDTYTLNGRTILGLGAEINRKNLQVKFIRGQFRVPRILTDTLVFGAVLAPTYKRKIWGTHLRLGNHRTFFEANILHAIDDTTRHVPDTTYAPPAANTVPEIAFGLGFFKIVRIYGRGALSIFSRNLYSSRILTKDIGSIPILPGLITPTLSTRANLAVKAGLEVSSKLAQIRLQYERIDPFFESMGLYYMQDDKENYTLNLSIPLRRKNSRWSGSAAGSLGFQQNNIKSSRSLTTLRRIGHINLNIARVMPEGEKGVNIYGGINYRNYQINQENGLSIINDTLRVSNLTQGGMGHFQLSWRQGKNTHRIGMNGMIHLLTDVNRPTLSYLQKNYQLSYALAGTSSDLNVSAHIQEAGLKDLIQKRAGMSAGFKKYFMADKLSTSMHASFSQLLPDAIHVHKGNTWSVQLNTSYQITRKHHLILRLIRQQQSTHQLSFKETRLSVHYQVRF